MSWHKKHPERYVKIGKNAYLHKGPYIEIGLSIVFVIAAIITIMVILCGD